MWGVLLVEFYASVAHVLIFGEGHMEFLPLMITSVYCGAGVMYCWSLMVGYYWKQMNIVLHNSYESTDMKVRWVRDAEFSEDDDDDDDYEEDTSYQQSVLASKYKPTTRRLNVEKKES